MNTRIVRAKVLRVAGLAQLVIVDKEDAPPLGDVILLTGRNRAENAKPGDSIQLERTEIDGWGTYKAVRAIEESSAT